MKSKSGDIDKYISKQKSPKKDIMIRVREIIVKTLPDCDEKMAWGVVTFADKKFYLAAMKDRVHIGFAITGLSKKEIDLFEGSGKTMRHIKIDSVEDIDEKKLVKLIRMVAKKAVCNKFG